MAAIDAIKKMLRGRFAFVFLCAMGCSAYADTPQPNVLLLVAEDMGRRVGAFGDPLANTPTLDRLAAEGVRYTNAFTTAGVCAPSRAALITGVHQNTLGAGHMRTQSSHWPLQYLAVPPPEVKAFPELLRRAGYYTFTDFKLDYQFSGPSFGTGPPTIWDAEGDHDRWRGRAPGQPFFGLINFMVTHESMIFAEQDITSPALVAMRRQFKGDAKGQRVAAERVIVPPFYPDTPEVRQDIATHYENISIMDAQVAETLRDLAEDGLLKNTIIIWTTDHGDGLPRFKREVFDTGIHVPMIVRWPEALAPAMSPGSVDARLVSFVDLAPTILQMAGVGIPTYVHGRSFLSSRRPFIFAARDRMDSEPDRQRAVRDRRFKYIRTYAKDRPGYMNLTFRNQMRLMRVWRQAFTAGTLSDVQARWFEPRATEALYDTRADPYELRNLVEDPRYRQVLERMRRALAAWQASTPDLGRLPEEELVARFWPGNVQPHTPPPRLRFDPETSTIEVAADFNASVRYRTNDGPWHLYLDPVRAAQGTRVSVRAVRYGWQESNERTITVPSEAPPP